MLITLKAGKLPRHSGKVSILLSEKQGVNSINYSMKFILTQYYRARKKAHKNCLKLGPPNLRHTYFYKYFRFK